MASEQSPAFRGEPGKRITILSIDGGGVRGMIATRILEVLETQLQDIDGPNASIADYFDVIAGTSTGGLIAAMLTCPDDSGRPLFTAGDASRFYMDYAATIFPPRPPGILGTAENFVGLLSGPKYSPENLERILNEKVGDIKMDQTITELLIPAYDIKTMEPTLFSTTAAKREAVKNAYLRDVCRGTSAAPTYFPPHFFEVQESSSNTSREYNLVDGGVAANNPTYLAIVHAVQKKFEGSASFRNRIAKGNIGNLMVLSLGTGTLPQSYLASDAHHWGALSWVLKDGRVPLFDTILNASADMVEFYLSVLFQTVEAFDNYLRIQAVNLSAELSALDNGTASNLQQLYELGDRLLDEDVTCVEGLSGRRQPQPSRRTNREALARFSQQLATEQKIRKDDKKERHDDGKTQVQPPNMKV